VLFKAAKHLSQQESGLNSLLFIEQEAGRTALMLPGTESLGL